MGTEAGPQDNDMWICRDLAGYFIATRNLPKELQRDFGEAIQRCAEDYIEVIKWMEQRK